MGLYSYRELYGFADKAVRDRELWLEAAFDDGIARKAALACVAMETVDEVLDTLTAVIEAGEAKYWDGVPSLSI